MFADKSLLLLLLLLPVLAVLFYVFYKKRKKDLGLLISKNNLSVLSNVDLRKYGIKYFFTLLGILFLILALARPQYGEKTQKVIKESSEIVIALDISRSMLAEDIKPNRLEKAKMMLMNVIEHSPGEKMGIIVFSGSAMWQCPMTYDMQALKMFLHGIEVGQLPLGGTQLSEAIDLAVKAVDESAGKNKVLLLISDGENHDSKIKESVSEAKKTGLKILAAGIGSYQGAPIPLKDESGQIRDYVKDRNGQIVMTKMNPALLKNIAQETGGDYYDASEKDISSALIKTISDLEKNKSGEDESIQKTDRFQLFLFIALILLFIDMIIPKVKK